MRRSSKRRIRNNVKNNNIKVVIVKSNNDKEWNSDLPIIDNGRCPYIKGYKVILKEEVYKKILAINNEIRDVEWAGYLYGKWLDDKTAIIEDIKIPEQEVTGASVDVKETDAKAFGTVHKHPWSGGTSFSGIDREYAMSNHDISLLIDADNKMVAKVRKKLPCGHYALADADIEMEKDENLKNWLEEAKKKIKRETVHYYTGYERVYRELYGTCPYIDAPEECPIKNYYKCSYTNSKCPYIKGNPLYYDEDEEDEEDFYVVKNGRVVEI